MIFKKKKRDKKQLGLLGFVLVVCFSFLAAKLKETLGSDYDDGILTALF